MSWFNRKKTAVLGIDISTVAIKVLELSRSGGQYRVESYSVAPLPQDVIADNTITDIDAIANALRVAVKQSGSKIQQVCVAVAAASVMTKIIAMPAALSEDEMEDQILVEADQYVPYPLDEINLDFEIQGETLENPGMVDVLLVASRRENIEDRVEALANAGLKAAIIDVEVFAIENAFSVLAEQLSDIDESKVVAIVDIGATMTNMNIIQNSRTVYTREQSFGGKQLTEEIQNQYGLSFGEAGLAKKQGGLPDNYITDVLEPFKQAAVQQISRSIQFFTSSNEGVDVDNIVLAGGCASIAGLDKLVEKELGITTYVANPFLKMSLSKRVKQKSLSNDAPAMMTACGLALRSFD
ncbi:MAG: pilus assembly protein PilM [Methylococcales bacterium]|nr:pilus assembly protein PilM [Methylococcales bacterium]